MCTCTYYSLFKLGIFSSYYFMVPGCTSAFSLLVNAALMCRFAPPLCYNFMHIIHVDDFADGLALTLLPCAWIGGGSLKPFEWPVAKGPLGGGDHTSLRGKEGETWLLAFGRCSGPLRRICLPRAGQGEATTFAKKMASMDLIPLLGSKFNTWFPLVLVVYCGALALAVLTGCSCLDALVPGRLRFDKDVSRHRARGQSACGCIPPLLPSSRPPSLCPAPPSLCPAPPSLCCSSLLPFPRPMVTRFGG